MTEVKNKKEVYYCQICGNVVEVLHVGGGELICCGEPMENLKEQTEDEGKEKHVPVIEKGENGRYKVKIGSVEHPMEEKHHIEWIELIVDGDFYERKFLTDEDRPEADFCVSFEHDKVTAREFCNVHGLWKKE